MAHLWGLVLASGSLRTASAWKSELADNQLLTKTLGLQAEFNSSEDYLSKPRTLQFWSRAMVVLPVLLQAPWVHLHPISACLFTFVLLGMGIGIGTFADRKWFQVGSLLVGISGSWLGGCLFWGWLRGHPLLHIPVEAVALPLAFVGLNTRWRVGAAFYLSCLLGTACTDLMMVFTGVMNKWPLVVQATFKEAPELLHETAQQLLNFQAICFLLTAACCIGLVANLMSQRARPNDSSSPWLVASAALMTTVWIDGLFLITALFQPGLSGLV